LNLERLADLDNNVAIVFADSALRKPTERMVSLKTTNAYEELFRLAYNRLWTYSGLRFGGEPPTRDVGDIEELSTRDNEASTMELGNLSLRVSYAVR